jgi:chloride channel protein, CIC family
VRAWPAISLPAILSSHRFSFTIARLFQVPRYALVHPLELAIYAMLGVAGGFLSVAFTRLLLSMREFFLQLPKSTRWCHPVVGGMAVGLMGLLVPQVLGVGYSYVGNALNGTTALKLMLLLVVLKLFGVTTSYASGNAGGIFGPSLFLGAMLGGALGTLACCRNTPQLLELTRLSGWVRFSRVSYAPL